MKNRRYRTRSETLTDPRFWAMHYYLQVDGDDVEASEIIEPLFGVSNKLVNEYFEQAFSEIAIVNQVEVPLRDGFSVLVGYDGDDSETRYSLNHRQWSVPVCVGHDSGCFALPAFRWREVEAIGCAGEGTNGARALLLMFPAAWITLQDDNSRIRPILEAAWTELGVTKPDRVGELAERLVKNRGVEIKWWQDPTLGWINDGKYSFRNPTTRMCNFEPDRFAKVQSFFRGIGAQRD